VAIGLAVVMVGFAMWSKTLVVQGSVETGEVDMTFSNFSCSDIPGQPDLGQDKDVGSATCTLQDTDGDGDGDVLQISVDNAYPGYQLMINNITIRSTGNVPIHITSTELSYNSNPLALVLEGFWTDNNMVCTQLHQGQEISGNMWLHVTQQAEQNAVYHFRVDIEAAQWNEAICEVQELGGTIGFWKNWNSHKTYTQAQIEAWLAAIDSESQWEGPTTTSAMVSLFKSYTTASMEQKLRAQYLATSLDIKAGRLSTNGGVRHNVTTLDPGNYLGLATPTSATLGQIVAAIESKYGTSPTEAQLEIMKNICDALNNLQV
jgi:hypothetical protein